MQLREAQIRKAGRRQPAFPAPLSADGALDLIGAPIVYSRNEEVFGEGEPAVYVYKIRSGCVRTYTSLCDGRRQIGAFYLPGDIFGLEARGEHGVSAEAIVNSRVRIVKKTLMMSIAAGDIAMTHHLLDLTTLELQRTQTHNSLLLKGAKARVVGFLLDLAERENSQSDIDLPMSSQDIADYLGLSIETVSRTLSRLESAAAIALPTTRRVILLDRSKLDLLIS